MKRGPDSGTLLLRALAGSARAADVRATFAPVRETAWRSATFSGARHVISGETVDGDDDWLRRLPDAEVALPGHVLAELTVGAIDREGARTRFVLRALTVEAA